MQRKRQKQSSRRSNSLSKRWAKLFKLIPGYDPESTAERGQWFDEKTADAVIGFFTSHLSHIEGESAGKPLALEPWQQAIVGCAFGWKRADGTRRYREVFQYVPRKNGKTTMIGGLVNLVAFCDEEPGAQIYSAAADREQATLVYRQAKGMILNNPELSAGCKVYSTYKSIEYPTAVYKALSSDADTKHGFNTHFCVVDELHAHYSRDLVDVLQTSTGSRRQPMMWHITTADFDRQSICNEKYDYACKVRDGVIKDSSFLPVIYEASKDDDWTKPEVWAKANPNLGVSVSREYFARECRKAQDVPSYTNTFLRLHLNVRTQNEVKWLSLSHWDKCGGAIIDADLAGRKCWGGLDLSSKQDITAYVLVFPPTATDPFYRVRPWFFIPEDNARQREKRDRVPYTTWARQGLLKMTEGNRVDYDFVKETIRESVKHFDVQDIAFDPWNATQISIQLQDEGANMVEFGQGFRTMSEPTKELEALVLSGKVAHGGNEVLRWMASNTTLETDAAGNVKPSKKKSTERIDGIVATVMALGRAITSPGDTTSVYESRGVETL